MIYPVDVIDVVVNEHQVAVATGQAVLACLGGKSHVRAGVKRQESLSEDQVVGQIAQLAFSLYLTGSDHMYRLQRFFCNQYPDVGDGGADIPGTKLDVKGSLMRAGNDPLRYNLLVREAERGHGKTYVLALMPKVPPAGKPAGVHLVGWATDESLPEVPEADGPFKGAYRVKAEDLNPLMPMRWWGW